MTQQQLPALAQQPDTSVDRFDASTLKPWAVILLAHVQDGDTIDQARIRSTPGRTGGISRDSIARYGAAHPDWYRARPCSSTLTLLP